MTLERKRRRRRRRRGTTPTARRTVTTADRRCHRRLPTCVSATTSRGTRSSSNVSPRPPNHPPGRPGRPSARGPVCSLRVCRHDWRRRCPLGARGVRAGCAHFASGTACGSTSCFLRRFGGARRAPCAPLLSLASSVRFFSHHAAAIPPPLCVAVCVRAYVFLFRLHLPPPPPPSPSLPTVIAPPHTDIPAMLAALAASQDAALAAADVAFRRLAAPDGLPLAPAKGGAELAAAVAPRLAALDAATETALATLAASGEWTEGG